MIRALHAHCILASFVIVGGTVGSVLNVMESVLQLASFSSDVQLIHILLPMSGAGDVPPQMRFQGGIGLVRCWPAGYIIAPLCHVPRSVPASDRLSSDVHRARGQARGGGVPRRAGKG